MLCVPSKLADFKFYARFSIQEEPETENYITSSYAFI